MDGWRWFVHSPPSIFFHISKSALGRRPHGTPRTGGTYNLLSELRVHPGLCWKLVISEKPDQTPKSSLTRDRRRR